MNVQFNDNKFINVPVYRITKMCIAMNYSQKMRNDVLVVYEADDSL